MSNLRSAEKARVSSCQLADEVADAVIAKFRLIHSQPVSGQIVLAGMVAVINAASVQVVSLGVGNKFEPAGAKREEALRDCHAEILARRAFKLFLLREHEKLTKGGENSDFFFLTDNGRLGAFSSVQWVLYISSCPCGNACVRRWGDSPKETFDTSLLPFEMPPKVPHATFLAHARHEGQTALSVKGESTILSCSDKILKWSVNGLEGVGLSGITETRILLDAVVVGRKFVRKHAERAFCCRLNSKWIDPQLRALVSHPLALCTGRKLDDGAMDAETGASFTDAVLWWSDSHGTEEIDGSTGKRTDGSPSALCPLVLRSMIPVPPDPHRVATSKLLELEMFKNL